MAIKKSKTEKNKELVEKIIKSVKGVGEPQINILNYKMTLIQALNFYNAYHSNKECKKWAVEYIAKNDKSLKSKLDDIPDYEFHTIGALARILSNGAILEDRELSYIKTKTEELLQYVPIERVETHAAVGVTQNVQENIKAKVASEISIFEDELDEFIRSGYPTAYQFKYNLVGKSPAVIKGLSVYLQKLSVEIKEALAGKCEQLNESYAKVGKAKLKSYSNLLDKMINSCAVMTAPKPRKTRTVKPKVAPVKPVKVVKVAKTPKPAPEPVKTRKPRTPKVKPVVAPAPAKKTRKPRTVKVKSTASLASFGV